MPTQLIADMGSCHCGKLAYAEEMLELCAPSKIWVKFQLCSAEGKNLPLDRSWLRFLVDKGKKLGIQVFCSIWKPEDIKTLTDAGCEYVKFAYTARNACAMHRAALAEGLQVIVTHDPMETIEEIKNVQRLWTVMSCPDQPAYPVTFSINHIGMAHRWDGFSCHSYDAQEVKRAVDAGYKLVEFHAKLPGQTGDAPDFRFAINIAEVISFSQMNHGGR